MMIIEMMDLCDRPFQQRLSLLDDVSVNSSHTCSGSSFHKSWVACSRPRVWRTSVVSTDTSPAPPPSASTGACALYRSCPRAVATRRCRSWPASLHDSAVPAESTQLWTCTQTAVWQGEHCLLEKFVNNTHNFYSTAANGSKKNR